MHQQASFFYFIANKTIVLNSPLNNPTSSHKKTIKTAKKIKTRFGYFYKKNDICSNKRKNNTTEHIFSKQKPKIKEYKHIF